jgi:hypothetical protein
MRGTNETTRRRGPCWLLLALVLLPGCGIKATRYTWTGDATQLSQVNLSCAQEIRDAAGYVPIKELAIPATGRPLRDAPIRLLHLDPLVAGHAAATANPFTGEIVGGVIPTLYKDCLEIHGYRKVKTDVVPLVGYECGTPLQTCLWFDRWGKYGVLPLPNGANPPQ